MMAAPCRARNAANRSLSEPPSLRVSLSLRPRPGAVTGPPASRGAACRLGVRVRVATVTVEFPSESDTVPGQSGGRGPPGIGNRGARALLPCDRGPGVRDRGAAHSGWQPPSSSNLKFPPRIMLVTIELLRRLASTRIAVARFRARFLCQRRSTIRGSKLQYLEKPFFRRLVGGSAGVKRARGGLCIDNKFKGIEARLPVAPPLGLKPLGFSSKRRNDF